MRCRGRSVMEGERRRLLRSDAARAFDRNDPQQLISQSRAHQPCRTINPSTDIFFCVTCDGGSCSRIWQGCLSRNDRNLCPLSGDLEKTLRLKPIAEKKGPGIDGQILSYHSKAVSSRREDMKFSRDVGGVPDIGCALAIVCRRHDQIVFCAHAEKGHFPSGRLKRLRCEWINCGDEVRP
jgi:hypothetical protein